MERQHLLMGAGMAVLFAGGLALGLSWSGTAPGAGTDPGEAVEVGARSPQLAPVTMTPHVTASVDEARMAELVRAAVADELDARDPGEVEDGGPGSEVPPQVQAQRVEAAREARDLLEDMRREGRMEGETHEAFRAAMAATGGHETQAILAELMVAINRGDVAPPRGGGPLL